MENRGTSSEKWKVAPHMKPMIQEPATQNPVPENDAAQNKYKRRKDEDDDGRETSALQSLQKFCRAEIKTLNCQRRRSLGRSDAPNMDLGRKPNAETTHCNTPEVRKGKQLTSIIDQLKINKTKDAAPLDIQQRKKKEYRPQPCLQQPSRHADQARGGLLTIHPDERGQHLHATWRHHLEMPTDALAATSSATGHNNNAAPKGDRGTPDAESSSSPSISPHSPSPGRGFPSLLPPGFGGLTGSLRVNSVAPFSPPPGLERFSPATGNPAIKQMEMMTRNYSDFMRCLAAKYNQNNAQEGFSMPQSNGLVRGYDTSFAYKGGSPFLVRNTDNDASSGGCLSGGLNRKLDNQNSPTTAESRNNSNNINSSNTVLGSNVGNCGISDFSSSQTLLNLVRTASAQSASQLENYLKGAVKRSADGESRLDPLDLTVGTVKRPKLELGSGRDLFPTDVEATLTGGDGSTRALSLGSGTKPSWMSLLDKRMHASLTTSLRTSPKIQNTERSRCVSLCVEKSCSSESEASDLSHWTVDDVVKFVSSVDTCSEYSERFREESIDGTTLPLLSEDHLTMHLGMKLGPALKLRSTLARRIGHCAVCMHCVHCHGDDNTDVRRHESSQSPTVSK